MKQDTTYPLRRTAPFRAWSPSIHYAKYQVLAPHVLQWRRLYDFELLFVFEGEAATTMNGQRHAIAAGQLVFLPAGVLHRNEVVAPNTRFLGIHFDFFNELAVYGEEDLVVNEDAVEPAKFCEEALAEPFSPLSSFAVMTPPPSCVALMEQLVQEFAVRPLGYELACKALMLGVLSQLLRLQFAKPGPGATVHGARIQALMAEIERRPAERWSNPLLAERLAMNEDHMAKLFKAVAGVAPGEFVRAVRHREARRLLRETDLTAEQIGERVGYADLHYFSRIFRKLEGVSPRAYRKLSRVL
ncbi:AraC family transcriptional regulator [Paenibacillus glycinis]|uniref:Helix-turn-helix domain-containing protein n=1 Tax=Paenibacillus glycinis TaxID=2697035 RepID=A0ABW9XS29_9BACL|nr:AraC family transcriptional regulator [Paenibacillus glycinis]NBD25356.1 helix-turn-helix domain-containing protein [Paenibacillus glycinis]